MTIQATPAYLQNASHSAALFRQAVSNPYVSAGVLGSGEMAVGAQSTPNMSVLVGAGRAKVAGTQISPPTLLSGATAAFTTQAMYDVLNDASVTLTIATADPTNPRIDTVYVAVQDAFYSGANNQAVLGVVTGAPAPSPVAPAAPSNALALGYVAVAANATSIVAGNITQAAAAGSLLPSGFLAQAVGSGATTLTSANTNYVLTDSPVTFTLQAGARIRIEARYSGGSGSVGLMQCAPGVVAGSSATLTGATIGSLRQTYIAQTGGPGFTELTASQSFLLAAGTYTAFTVGQAANASSSAKNSMTSVYAVGIV